MGLKLNSPKPIRRAIRQAIQDDLPDYFADFLPQGVQAGLPLRGELVIFAGPPFKDPDPGIQEIGLFQGVQQGVEASRADLIALVVQVFAQLAAVDRPQACLMQDDEFDHTLPKCLGDLLA